MNGSGYSIRALLGDVSGGFTAALVMLPLALAYGVASGLGAIAGLYGAIALGIVVALVGGTRTMISGPTAPLAITLTVVVASHGRSLAEVVTITLLAGLMQIALGTLRVGRYVSYTPYSVVSGVLTGVGLIIIVLQSRPFAGLPAATGGLVDTIRAWPGVVADVNVAALIVAAFTLAVAASWPRRLRHFVPSAAVALIAGTALSALWLSDVPIVGDVPRGLPDLHMPDLSLVAVSHAVQPAVVIAIIGSLDTLFTAVVVRSMIRQPETSNRDMLAQGIGTIATGLVGGVPGGGSFCTIPSIRAGARSRVSGVVYAAILLGLVLGLGKYAESIPLAVVAGILMKIGWDFIDWRFMMRVHRVQREHLAIMVATLVVATLFDLVVAVGVGLIVATLTASKQLERLELDRVISAPLLDRTFLGSGSDPEQTQDDQFAARVGLVALKGSFTVASSRTLIDTIGADIRDHDVVILDFSDTLYVDDSAALVVEHMVEVAAEQNTETIVLGLSGQPATCLVGLGVLRDVSGDHFVENLDEARDLARRLLTG